MGRETIQIIKQGLIRGASLGVGLLVVFAISFTLAQGMKSFGSGQVVSAADINANFQIAQANFAKAAPAGKISAFYLTNCPPGWVLADGTNGTPDLRGVFIRGRDPFNAAGRDPDGARSIGHFQDDRFQGHLHGAPAGFTFLVQGVGGAAVAPGAGLDTRSSTGTPQTDGVNGAPRTANETRPENVALTLCMRKD